MGVGHCPSDLSDEQRALVLPRITPAKSGGRHERRRSAPCLMRPSTCPGPAANVWIRLRRALYPQVRSAARRKPGPALDFGRSVSEDRRRESVRGFDGHKRAKGLKRQILVDVLWIPTANRRGRSEHFLPCCRLQITRRTAAVLAHHSNGSSQMSAAKAASVNLPVPAGRSAAGRIPDQ
jgi:hypothetical protein